MAKYEDLKIITEARLQTIHTLIDAQDWIVSAYMMGCVLEYALKAVACKTLHLSNYPPLKSKKIEAFFRTHEFDSLLLISGMLDVFGSGGNCFGNWSAFTQEYLGQWTEMRFEVNNQNSQWDEIKTNNVYNKLKIIINEIRKKW